MLSPGGARGVEKLTQRNVIQTKNQEAPHGHMYYIGLMFTKKTIAIASKMPAVRSIERQIGSSRLELDA